MPHPSSAEVKNKWYRYASIRPIRLNREIYLMSLEEHALLSPVLPLTNNITICDNSLITLGCGGEESNMDTGNFNLRRSQVRKMGNIRS